MKKFRIATALLIIVFLVVLCVGCSPDLSKYENTDVRLQTEAMLDAMIANDPSSAYVLTPEGAFTEKDFTEAFGDLRQMLGNSDSYELHLLYTQVNTSYTNTGNSKHIRATYDMKCDAGRFIVDVATDENLEIITFYITPYEKTDYYLTGTLNTMHEANAAQWVFILLNVLVLGFTVFAIVDCCRQKIRKKALWILLLVFGFITVGFTLSATAMRINFNLGWLSAYTALILYGSGAMVIRFMLPVGAIVYFIVRKSLLGKNPPQPENEYSHISMQIPTDHTNEVKPEQIPDQA